MGWRYEDLYFTPPVHFFDAMKAYLEHEETRQRQLYEIIRMHSATILNSFTKRTIRPSDIMRFPWDKTPHMARIEDLRKDPVLQSWAANPPKRSYHPHNS